MLAAPHDTQDFRVDRCPVCGRNDFRDRFSSHGSPIVECDGCGLLLRNPQPSDEVQQQIYDEDYFLWAGSEEAERVAAELKQATARLYLEQLSSPDRSASRRLLEVGCGHGDFLSQASRAGYQVTGVEYSRSAVDAARAKVPTARILCGELESCRFPSRSFDVCVLADVIEHVRRPREFLEEIQRLLVPGGELFVVTPSLDSFSARALGRRWVEFKLEHLYYFNQTTLRRLLAETGFEVLAIRAGKKVLNAEYIFAHFERFPAPLITPLLRLAGHLAPQRLWRRQVVIHSGGMSVVARSVGSMAAGGEG